MALFLPQRWRQQPQGSIEIDWSNSLTRGLIAAWTGSNPLRELVAGTSVVNTIPTLNPPAIGRRGRVYRQANPTNVACLELISGSRIPTGVGAVTLGYRKTDSTLRDSSAFGVGRNGATQRFQAHVPWQDGITYFDYGNTSGNNRISASGLTFGDDVWTFASTNTGLRFWQNGILRASNSAGIVTRTAGTEWFRIAQGTSNGDASETSFMYLHNRHIADAEVRHLHENPWQIFKPQKQIVYCLPPEPLPTQPLYSVINETVSDRTNYIKTNVENSVAELSLRFNEVTTIKRPKPNTDMVINYDAGMFGNAAIKIELIEVKP